MIAIVEADGLMIRMDSRSQTADVMAVFPSGAWGKKVTVTLSDLIHVCKTIQAGRDTNAQ